jgi:hypothetical protein
VKDSSSLLQAELGSCAVCYIAVATASYSAPARKKDTRLPQAPFTLVISFSLDSWNARVLGKQGKDQSKEARRIEGFGLRHESHVGAFYIDTLDCWRPDVSFSLHSPVCAPANFASVENASKTAHD